tara:strand:+ start:761 stop:1423 length:663 start_codon:yes stop_codon:yes gene_type:complete
MIKKIIILFLSAVAANAHDPNVVIDGKASSFKLIRGNFTWHEAKADAEARGGHLATVTTLEEQEHIEKIISGKNRDAWIGGEQKKGSWQWVTGENWAFDNWDNNEPNGGQTEKHINIWGTNKNINSPNQSGKLGKWNDFREHYKMSYILERSFVRVGIKSPPCGKRFALMVSTDLKNWEIAKDVNGKKCMNAFASNSNTKEICLWWNVPEHKRAFYKISK